MKYQDLSRFFHNDLTAELGDCIKDLALNTDVYRTAITEIALRCFKDAPDVFPKIALNYQEYERLAQFIEELVEPCDIFRSLHRDNDDLINKKFATINQQFESFIELFQKIDSNVEEQFQTLKIFYQDKLKEWQQADKIQRQELKNPPTRISSEYGYFLLPKNTALEMLSLSADEYGVERKKNEDGQNAVSCLGQPGKKIHCKIETKTPIAPGIQSQCFWIHGYLKDQPAESSIVKTTLIKVEVTIREYINLNWTSIHQVEPADLKRFTKEAIERHIEVVNHIKSRIKNEELSDIFNEDPTLKEKLIKYPLRINRLVQVTKTVENGLPLSHIVELSKQVGKLVEKLGKDKVIEILPAILSRDYFQECLSRYSLTEETINTISDEEMFSLIKEFITKYPQHKIKFFNTELSESELNIRFLDTRQKIPNNYDFFLGLALLEKIPELAAEQNELFEVLNIAKRFQLIKFFFKGDKPNLKNIVEKLPRILQDCYDQNEYCRMELANILCTNEDQKSDNLFAYDFVFDGNEIQSFKIKSIDADRAFTDPIINGVAPKNMDAMHAFPHIAQPIPETFLKRYSEQQLALKYISIFEQVFRLNQKFLALIYSGTLRLEDLLQQDELSSYLRDPKSDPEERNLLKQILERKIQNIAEFESFLERFPRNIDVPIVPSVNFNELFDIEENIQEEMKKALQEKRSITMRDILEMLQPVISFLYQHAAKKNKYPDDVINEIFEIGSSVESVIKKIMKEYEPEIQVKELKKLLANISGKGTSIKSEEPQELIAAIKEILESNISVRARPQSLQSAFQNFVNQKLGKIFQDNNSEQSYLLLCKIAEFATLKALPIKYEQLISYFYQALAEQNIAVMRLLISCHTNVEAINPKTKNNAIDEAVSLQAKESFLFLINQGVGSKQFNFENVYKFFVENLADVKERKRFEIALYQLCQTNFRFYAFYFKKRFFEESDFSQKTDCIDPLANQSLVLSVGREAILAFMNDTKTQSTKLIIDGLPVVLTKMPLNMLLSDIMQHHAQSFFTTNLVRPSFTYLFIQGEQLLPVSFAFQLDAIPIGALREKQLTECLKYLSPLNYSEHLLFALSFSVHWGNLFNYLIRKKLTGTSNVDEYEIILNCNEVVEDEFTNEPKNALFLLDMIKKRVPTELYAPTRREKVEQKNWDAWFNYLIEGESNFLNCLEYLQKQKIDVASLQLIISKKIFFTEESLRKVLDSLSDLKRIVYQQQDNATKEVKGNKVEQFEIAIDSNLTAIGVLDPNIPRLIIKSFEDYPSTARRLSAVFPKKTIQQIRGSKFVRSDSIRKVLSILNTLQVQQTFRFYMQQKSSIDSIVKELYNGNVNEFNKISSIAIKKEILEKIEIKSIGKKILPVILNCFKTTPIEKLSFEDCKNLKFDEMKGIIENTNNLTSLNLSKCDLKQKQIEELLVIAIRNNPNLRTLYLTNMSQLESLTLRTIQPDKDFKLPSKLQLKTLFVNECGNLKEILIDCATIERIKITENTALNHVVVYSPAVTDLLLPKQKTLKSEHQLPLEVIVEQAVLTSLLLMLEYKEKKEQLQSVSCVSQDALLNTLKQAKLLSRESLEAMQFSLKLKWNLPYLNLTTRDLELVFNYVVDQIAKGKFKKVITLDINFFGAKEINWQEMIEIAFKFPVVGTISAPEPKSLLSFSKLVLASNRKGILGFVRTVRNEIIYVTPNQLMKENWSEKEKAKEPKLAEIKGKFAAISTLQNGFVVTLDEQNGLLQIWDPNKGRCVKFLAGDGGTPVGIKVIDNMIVSVKKEGFIRVWHPHEERIAYILNESEGITFHSFAENEKLLLWIGANQGKLISYDMRTKFDCNKRFQEQCTVYRVFNDNDVLVTAIENIESGRTVAVGSSIGNISVIHYEQNSHTELMKFKNNANGITSLKLMQKGSYLLSGSTCSTVVIWSLISGGKLAAYTLECGPIRSFEFVAGFNNDKTAANPFSILSCGAAGFIYELEVKTAKLDILALKQQLNSIEIFIDKTEFTFNFAAQIKNIDAAKKLLCDFLAVVFPDLEMQQVKNDTTALKFLCKSKRSSFITETLQKCGFMISFPKAQEESLLAGQSMFAKRLRLNTALGKYNSMVMPPLNGKSELELDNSPQVPSPISTSS